MGMGIARIPIPKTQIPRFVGYNTHLYPTKYPIILWYLDEIFFYYTKNQFYLKKNL